MFLGDLGSRVVSPLDRRLAVGPEDSDLGRIFLKITYLPFRKGEEPWEKIDFGWGLDKTKGGASHFACFWKGRRIAHETLGRPPASAARATPPEWSEPSLTRRPK